MLTKSSTVAHLDKFFSIPQHLSLFPPNKWLLAAMICMNNNNCKQFATRRLDWLVRRLNESQDSSTGTPWLTRSSIDRCTIDATMDRPACVLCNNLDFSFILLNFSFNFCFAYASSHDSLAVMLRMLWISYDLIPHFLAALLTGNPSNCKQFASSYTRIDLLSSRLADLESQAASGYSGSICWLYSRCIMGYYHPSMPSMSATLYV